MQNLQFTMLCFAEPTLLFSLFISHSHSDYLSISPKGDSRGSVELE